MRKVAFALAGLFGIMLSAGVASAEIADLGDLSKLTDVLGADCPPFEAQMVMDSPVMAGQDRVMEIYYVPGKIRVEGTASHTAYIALPNEKMYYVNFEGNWLKMPMGAGANLQKTGIEEIDNEIFEAKPARYTTRRLGVKNYDGKACDVIEVTNESDGRRITTWEWKERHTPLQIVTQDHGVTSRVLFRNFRFVVPPRALFAPPPGAKVMTVQDFAKNMQDGGLESLQKGLGQ